MKPKKSDLPRRAQRKFKIKQKNKLLFSALLCALVKWKQYNILGAEFITWGHREKLALILFFNYEIILRVLCGLKKSLNLGKG